MLFAPLTTWAQPHFVVENVSLIGGDSLPSDHETVYLQVSIRSDGDPVNDVVAHLDLTRGAAFISAMVQTDYDFGAMNPGDVRDTADSPFEFVTAFYDTEQSATFTLTLITDDGSQQIINLDPTKTLLGIRGGFPGFSTNLGLPHRFQGNTLVRWQGEGTFLPSKVYVTDLTTYASVRLSDVDSNQLVPDIDNGRVVWCDSRRRHTTEDIYYKDLSVGDEVLLSPDLWVHSFPRIFGDYVVWQADHFDLTTDIYLYTLSKSEGHSITTSRSGKIFPRISGNRVVWADNRNLGEDTYSIYAYDLTLNQEFTGPTAAFLDVTGSLEIDGDNLVYVPSFFVPYVFYIYNFPTGTTTPVITPGFIEGPVVISGKTVVWAEAATLQSPAHIMVYNIDTGARRQITTDVTNRGEHDPVIFGNRIVWFDYRLGFSAYWLTNLVQ